MKFVEAPDNFAVERQDLQFKKYFVKLLRRWPRIVLFFLFALLVGYAFNRYSTPVYAVKARITTSKFSGKPTTPVPGLVDANFFLSGLTEVYEEIPILKSPKRIAAAVERVDLGISYFASGWVKDTESSKGFGFNVEVDTIRAGAYPYGVPIYVNHLSSEAFELSIGNETWDEKVKGERYLFGSPFELGSARLTVFNTNGNVAEKDKYYFVMNRKADLVSEYSRKLDINWALRGSAMLDLRIESESPEQDLRFMEAYYQVVERMGLEEKNQTLDNTISFIDDQMESITDSLIYFQELIDGKKLENRKLTLGSEYIYSKLNDMDEQRAQILLKERYFDYLIDYFNSNSDAEVFAPSLMGLSIQPVESWVNQYINAKLTSKTFRNEFNFQNPLVNKQDSLRGKLVKGIFEGIRSVREQNRKSLYELDRQEDFLFSSVKDVQTDFREMSRYQRMYQLNQTLFDLFLRRKTEAAISKASATSDYKVIDAPGFSRVPIRPDRQQTLMIAAIAGLVLPIGFFLFRDLSNNKIMDKDDLQNHTQIPLLGNVAHSTYRTNMVLSEHPRSVVSESFRAVRANLKYLVSDLQTRAHTFLITSSVGGEGKTFCSLNLAYTLAVSQKKTLLIGADLRKPQLAGYMSKSDEHKGLSEYLAGLATLEEIINTGDDSKPDFIDSGNIPPNPSELMGGEQMRLLMEQLKERYEYIIIDTPPIGLVSDAMELFKYTDYNILIVRQHVTHKGALDMINELYLDGRLKNFSVLFNDIHLSKRRGSYYGGYLYGMGYSGYGYGYYQEDKENGKNLNGNGRSRKQIRD